MEVLTYLTSLKNNSKHMDCPIKSQKHPHKMVIKNVHIAFMINYKIGMFFWRN